jgi:uncharacterized protein (UPF0548 family)
MQARTSALAGLALWVASLAALHPPVQVAIFLAGPLVAAPLALGLAHPGGPRAPLRGRWAVALALQLPAAAGVVASFALAPGAPAALWTLPWLAFAVLLALLALLRFLEHGARPLPEVAVDAGLAFLLVGAFWLTFSRWGKPFLGFGEPIEFLTAAHFHFAGLVLPVLGGLAGRALPGRLAALTALGVVAGMPLVAVGIITQQQGIMWVNQAAVSILALATLGVIALQSRLAVGRGPVLARALWGVSAAALPVGMTLAVLWAYGGFGQVSLSVDGMVRTHAVLNVFGFALPGLLAWTLAGVPEPAPSLQVVVRPLGDRVAAAQWSGRPPHPGTAARRPGDHEDRHEARLGAEPPGPPLPGGCHRRAAEAVLRYDIFPRSVLRPSVGRTPLQAGDTVAGEHPLAPGLGVAMGARVTEVFDGPAGGAWRTGFSYVTLAGHPECGEETFAVEKAADGTVRLVLTSWSRPGHPLSRLLAGWARRRQVRAGQAALAKATATAGAAPPASS